MTAREAWAAEIAARWRVETASGVVVYPGRAAVEAMENLGAEMAGARRLLVDAAAAYERQDWSALAAALARVNVEIAARLPAVRRGEPETWADYRARTPAGARPRAASPSGLPADYVDRVRGAWLGKCIGTALGDPVEGWTSEAIRRAHGEVTGYLVPPKVENDDTAYPILVLHALDERGAEFTSADLAFEWVSHLPLAFTAEWSAIENVKAGTLPPESRWARNPCGAWVGGQMRTEIHGLLAPLDPETAAELAFRDAVISHYREGMDGAIYAAVLTSLAFSGRPIAALLREGLRFVRADGAFARIVESTLDACRRHGEWRGVLDELRPRLDEYHWIHTIPNIACAVAGLTLGEGDFERSILTTLWCGYDTDCSTGQTAALLGCLLGASRLPEKWTAPIGRRFQSYVVGFEEVDFDRLVAWTAGWAGRLAAGADAKKGGAA